MTPFWYPADPRPVVAFLSVPERGAEKLCFVLGALLASLRLRAPFFFYHKEAARKLGAVPEYTMAAGLDLPLARLQEHGFVFAQQAGSHHEPDENEETQPGVILARLKAVGAPRAVVLLNVPDDAGASAAAYDNIAQELIAAGQREGLLVTVSVREVVEPLGAAFGGWLEVKEAVACLDCRGPSDLEELLLSVAAEALLLTGKAGDVDSARSAAGAALASGEPRKRFEQYLAAEGASLKAFRTMLASETIWATTVDCGTQEEGVITRCDAALVREIVRDLESGPGVGGLDQLAKIGEPFGPGCTMARIHAGSQDAAERAADRLHLAFSSTEEDVSPGQRQLRIHRPFVR
ncbi:MAG TPA: hypothetical protein VEH27_20220 [Methylomirabilota bacterium]|nr:hypothetical protein [Methylomirabilota bacterium]